MVSPMRQVPSAAEHPAMPPALHTAHEQTATGTCGIQPRRGAPHNARAWACRARGRCVCCVEYPQSPVLLSTHWTHHPRGDR